AAAASKDGHLYAGCAGWLNHCGLSLISRREFMILVTGGAGFIGANFVLDWLDTSDETVLNVDKLTYAGNLGTLQSLQGNPNHIFARVDICERAALDALFAEHKPRAVLHFAAESHVDRSIHGPADFVQTNVVGTFTLLEAARSYWNTLNEAERA